jgi:hypothetical protein
VSPVAIAARVGATVVGATIDGAMVEIRVARLSPARAPATETVTSLASPWLPEIRTWTRGVAARFGEHSSAAA